MLARWWKIRVEHLCHPFPACAGFFISLMKSFVKYVFLSPPHIQESLPVSTSRMEVFFTQTQLYSCFCFPLFVRLSECIVSGCFSYAHRDAFARTLKHKNSQRSIKWDGFLQKLKRIHSFLHGMCLTWWLSLPDVNSLLILFFYCPFADVW